jgi:glycosyltransferase involved in cell wall biosynthesis
VPDAQGDSLKRLRILLVSHLYPENDKDRSTTRALHNFVRNWESQCEVLVIRAVHISLKRPFAHPWFSRGSVEGVPVSSVIVISMLKARVLFPLGPLVLLAWKRFKPDVIVAHMKPNYRWAGWLARFLGKPFVAGIHGSDILASVPGFQAAIKHADLIACRSPSIAKRFKEFCPQWEERVFIANSGIEASEILPESAFRAKAGLWQGRTRFITVSKLLPGKNHDLVLRGLGQLRHLDWDYVIIGDGPLQSSLAELVKALGLEQRVVFRGWLSRAEALEEMERSQVFLMPSAPETFGLAYLEAMAKACLVVCAEGWGVDGIIRDGVDGFTVKPTGLSELTCLLSRLLSLSPEQKVELLVRVRVLVASLTEEAVALRYLDAIRSVAQRPRVLASRRCPEAKVVGR